VKESSVNKTRIEIFDIAYNKEYEKYLYRCLAPMPYRKYKKRDDYLKNAIPNGFHKKLLEVDGEIVGQIEYSLAELSGFPISGEGIYVMNCIWILRKVKGNNLGKLLLNNAISSLEKENAEGIATLGLENHPSPWLKRDRIEKLGFNVIKSMELRICYKEKYRGQLFKVHLMWLPIKKNTNMAHWDTEKLLRGVTFCLAHPLYHSQSIKPEQIFEKVGDAT